MPPWGQPGSMKSTQCNYDRKRSDVNKVQVQNFAWNCLKWLAPCFTNDILLGGEITVGGGRVSAWGGVGDPGRRLQNLDRLHRAAPHRPHHCHRHRLPSPCVSAIRNSGLLAIRLSLFIEIYLWYWLKHDYCPEGHSQYCVGLKDRRPKSRKSSAQGQICINLLDQSCWEFVILEISLANSRLWTFFLSLVWTSFTYNFANCNSRQFFVQTAGFDHFLN